MQKHRHLNIKSNNHNKHFKSRSKVNGKQHKKKQSTKTTLLNQNNQTDDFGLKSKSKLNKILTQSTQQLQTLYLFKNAQIKKSIQLGKHHILKHKNKSPNKLEVNIKGNKQTKNQNQINPKLNNKAKQNIGHVLKKHLAKERKVKKKQSVSLQLKRMQNLKKSCIKMLKEKQQQKQSQLQTLKIMHVLEQAEFINNDISSQQKRRLLKIHSIENMLKIKQIGQVQIQIQQIKQQNQISNQYFCQDSWI